MKRNRWLEIDCVASTKSRALAVAVPQSWELRQDETRRERQQEGCECKLATSRVQRTSFSLWAYIISFSGWSSTDMA
jgi:hypothetical protein